MSRRREVDLATGPGKWVHSTSILSGLGKDTPYGGCVKYRLLASVMAVADP
jgi:hypothetical protein